MEWLRRWSWSYYSVFPSGSRSTHNARRPPRSFPQFAELPPELRLQIWEESLPHRRIHVTRPNGVFEGDKCFRYHQLDAQTNQALQWVDRQHVPLINHEAYEIYKKAYDVVNLASIRPMATQLMDERGRIYTELFADGRYIFDESRQKSFLMRWDSDLIYIADPYRTGPFGNFCSNPVSHRVQHLALLIGELRTGRSPKEWSGHGLHERLKRLKGETKKDKWDALDLAHVRLVIFPGVYGDDPAPDTKRDEFGFVPYGDVCEPGCVLSEWQVTEAERLYTKIEVVLKDMFPSLRKPGAITRVVDVDVDVFDDGHYSRYSKPRRTRDTISS
jgi:hypothetical protein